MHSRRSILAGGGALCLALAASALARPSHDDLTKRALAAFDKLPPAERAAWVERMERGGKAVTNEERVRK